MKATTWLAFTLSLLLCGAGAVAVSSYEMDVFGVFHDPMGKHLSVNDNVRTSKFLLNQRYVPANFNAILIGSSSTMNWDMSKLDFAHFYNESIQGSNVAEEKRLVDQALPHAHFKYAICLISPYFLRTHNFNEGNGRPTRREALGSINVLREEVAMLARRLRHARSPSYPDGSEDIVAPANLSPATNESFTIDPGAVEAYRELIEELREHGVKVIFLRAPYYGPIQDRYQSEFQRFYASIPLSSAAEPIIDFDSPKYAELRANPAYWHSMAHLSAAGALQASVDLNQEIHQTLPGLAPSSNYAMQPSVQQ